MPPADDTPYEIRTATPEDTGLVEALDGSFTTATVFRVEMAENGFTLRETPVDPPLTKVFPEDENDEGSGAQGDGASGPLGGEASGTQGDEGDRAAQGDPTFLALAADGSLAGFVSVTYARWNRRLTIVDIEVAPGHRGRGVGRALMSRAEEFAREQGAGHIWLEVTNINAPAIHAYRRMGFSLCGLDTSLYEFTASAGEYALYLSKPCR
ncbi:MULTISPECIES: GNAT family N-acetyltransferase [unclassified Streptomyces]|uniref:GNAT family N-acetyltransferase n=1 Tax=unclassified Streptomyces TaxID=2593676 RepID=UPI001FAC8DC6|nr:MULTISPECIES: GNAT family N-acetyltransferase [unclassified Streptomyces]MDX2919169.1 GNAT family N-acetyltransferase [Streptomyces sp. NE06-03C]